MFSVKIPKNDPLRTALCKEIEDREAYASRVLGNKTECKKKPTFNIEGAVTSKDNNGNSQVWIGLRAPLINDKAVLLRLKKKRDKFRFTAIAKIDLKGHGIRALERDGETIWVVGGPEGKTLHKHSPIRKHTLWKFSQKKLKHNADIKPEKINIRLPEYVEGLAISGGYGIIVVDGEEDKDDVTRCEKPGLYGFLDMSGF